MVAIFFSGVFIFLISLIKLLISTEPFSRLLYIYILNINSRWFVILKIHLSVSTKKPKMVVCGVNSGRFKSVEKNIWLHSWLTRTHSQNKCEQSHHLNGKWNIEENLFFQRYTASYLGIVCYEVFCIGRYVDSY